MQVLIVGDLNVASERIDIHPRIPAPEDIYSPEERQMLAALIHRCPLTPAIDLCKLDRWGCRV